MAQLGRVNSLRASLDFGSGGGGQKSPFQEAIESLKEQKKQIQDNVRAYSRLRKEGFSVADAFKAAKDPILAAALASTKVDSSRWRQLLGLIKEVNKEAAKLAVQDFTNINLQDTEMVKITATVRRQLEAAGYSAKVIERLFSQIGDNPEILSRLAKDLKDGKLDAKDLVALLKSIENWEIEINLNLSPEEMDAMLSEAFGMVDSAFSAMEDQLTLDFRLGTNLSGSNPLGFAMDKINETIAKARAQIEDLEYQIDDLEAELFRLSIQEDKINEKYDERIKALDQVQKINQAIANQQKSQLTLADALSQGDISAAAKAMQEMRAQQASEAAQTQKDQLELAREGELNALRTASGRSRKDIEEQIKKLKLDIFNIEEDTLEPAEQQLRFAERALKAAIDTLDYLGKSKTAWEALRNGTNLARIEAEGYRDAIADALKLIPKLAAAWANAKNEQGQSSGPLGGATLSTFRDGREFITATRGESLADVAARTGVPVAVLQEANTKFTDKSNPAYDSKYQGGAYLPSNTKIFIPAEYQKASGGYIDGPGTETSDSIPALLSKGEYVIKASSVKKIGTDMLNILNKDGELPGFFRGGPVMADRPNVNRAPAPKPAPRPVPKPVSKPRPKQPPATPPRTVNSVLGNIAKIAMNPLKVAGDMASKLFLGENIHNATRSGDFSRVTGADAGLAALSLIPGGSVVKGAGAVSSAAKQAGPIASAFKNLTSKVSKKFETVRSTKSLVTRSQNPHLNRSLMDPSKVEPMQGRSLGPGMYFAPNAATSEKYWGGLGSTAYSPKIGPMAAIRLLRSKGYAGAEDLSRLGIRIDKGDNIGSPSIQRLMKEGYIGYRGYAQPNLSDAAEVTNWLVGASGGLGLKKLRGAKPPRIGRRFFANGGPVRFEPKGTDTVPAMLTPGEFVMNKAAVKRIGATNLGAINRGRAPRMAAPAMPIPAMSEPRFNVSTTTSAVSVPTNHITNQQTTVENPASVYNYSLSVNVSGSNVDANTIANTVMTRIQQMESQNVRRQVVR
jgi:hypothetical protein